MSVSATKTASLTWTISRFNKLLIALSSVTLLAATLLFSATSQAENTSEKPVLSALKPYSIKYKVVHDGDDVGTASRQLTQLSNGQWQIAMESDISYYFLSDKRQETSRFAVDGEQILPIMYQRLSETSFRSDSTLLQNFDWDNMIEQGSYKGDQWNQPLKIGYLDQLTQITLVREHLLTQRPIPAIDISYRGSIRHHEFKVLGQETIKTRKGNIKTAKVQLNEKERDRQTNFWFALEHNMLPVQVQRIKEGEEQAKLIATDW
ncbi:DUF3108 domain-containing protein [Kangiella taiwanensis]|uniref:DUF3108 domain-containing protein n=1 Tax=Kangiella taiwanensis TaxID=1079179 RepID=UPI001CBB2EC7|nr:DUF3108 domain-containing protein [Kangiella taiwanensis]